MSHGAQYYVDAIEGQWRRLRNGFYQTNEMHYSLIKGGKCRFKDHY